MKKPVEKRPIFLTAAWRHLVMLNYACPPELLAARVPRGVSLDLFRGVCYVSVVGFLFLDTRVLGVPIPWHRHFEEVNLRFYVRREHPDGARRGVVFVKELVPRRMIAWVARGVYNEPYATVPMEHAVNPEAGTYHYGWRHAGMDCAVGGTRTEAPTLQPEESEAAFITEHYWGYTRLRGGGTAEYEVEHPSWCIAPLASAYFNADVARLYGPEFVEVLAAPPCSALVAEGSEVLVRRGTRIA